MVENERDVVVKVRFIGTFVVASTYLVAVLVNPAWSTALSGGAYGTSSSGGVHALVLPFAIFCIAQVQIGWTRLPSTSQLSIVLVAVWPILGLIVMHFLPIDKDQLGIAFIATLLAFGSGIVAAIIEAVAARRRKGWACAVALMALWVASIAATHRMIFESGWLLEVEFAGTLVLGLVLVVETIVLHKRFDWRAQRLNMHQCPECGYPLEGLPRLMCPECGWSATDVKPGRISPE